MAQFDVDGARKAGYSDDEILSHLTGSRNFDVEGALNSGYSKADIINHLAGTAPKALGPSIAPTLLESRRAASRSEFEANQPESTFGTRAREAAIGVLEPLALQNLVPSTASFLKRGVTAALTGNAREALDLAKGVVGGAIQPVRTFAQGLSEGDYDKAAYGAGGILSQTVPAVESVGAPFGRNVVQPALRGGAERLYSSALQPSARRFTPTETQGMVRAGLQEGLPLTRGGMGRMKTLQDALNRSIEQSITNQAAPINKFDVARRLNAPAYEFGPARQVNPEADLAAIAESGNEFLRNQPPYIEPTAAQALKTGTYQQLKNRAYGELRGASVEAQKNLARGLKEELEARFPGIQGLNERL